MKPRNLIALSALLLGLTSATHVGAAQKDEAFSVLTAYKQTLEDKEGATPELLASLSLFIEDETTDPGALTGILRELHPEFGEALEAAADTGNEAGIDSLKNLAESDNGFLAAEANYFLARSLMNRQRLEEALPIFVKIQEDYFDQSLRIGESIYYQGVCEANTLQRDAASISLNDFVDLYPDAPERLIAEANEMIGSIEGVLDGSINDVADHMDFATNKLELVDSGEVTQEVQDDIIAMLDELIDKAENSPP